MDGPNITKPCSQCGEVQSLDSFTRHRAGLYGRTSQCKTCDKAYRAANKERIRAKKQEWAEKNKERLSVKSRAYREANKERIAECGRRYNEENFERIAEYKRAYREANLEVVTEYNRRYYAANAERIKRQVRQYQQDNAKEISARLRRWREENPAYAAEYHRAYYEAHKEYFAEQGRKWRKNNRAKVRAAKAAYRALAQNAGGTFTAEDVWAMHDSQYGLCAYCECPLFGEFHVEHMTPLSRGGSNGWENLALSCPTCNLRKGTKTVIEFMEALLRG